MDEIKRQEIAVDLANHFLKKMSEQEPALNEALTILTLMTTKLLLCFVKDGDEDGKELFSHFSNVLEIARSLEIKNLKNNGTND